MCYVYFIRHLKWTTTFNGYRYASVYIALLCDKANHIIVKVFVAMHVTRCHGAFMLNFLLTILYLSCKTCTINWSHSTPAAGCHLKLMWNVKFSYKLLGSQFNYYTVLPLKPIFVILHSMQLCDMHVIVWYYNFVLLLCAFRTFNDKH